MTVSINVFHLVARTEVTLKCFEDKMVITFSSPNEVDRYSFTGAG